MAVKGQKLSLGDDQIGQRKEDVPLRRVLLQPLVADLAMAEEILHDVKGVLDLRADARLDRFQATQQCAKLALPRDRLQLAALGRHLPVDVPVFQLCARLSAGVTGLQIVAAGVKVVRN